MAGRRIIPWDVWRYSRCLRRISCQFALRQPDPLVLHRRWSRRGVCCPSLKPITKLFCRRKTNRGHRLCSNVRFPRHWLSRALGPSAWSHTTCFLRKAAASSLEHRQVGRLDSLRCRVLVCSAVDTASLAACILFGKLFGVATLVGFGEKRCRKNLPLCGSSPT